MTKEHKISTESTEKCTCKFSLILAFIFMRVSFDIYFLKNGEQQTIAYTREAWFTPMFYKLHFIYNII